MNRLPEIPEGVTALLTVEAEGICAKIRLLLKEAGEWREIFSTEGFVGKNGVTDCKREGDGCTPAGLFPLDTAFGTAEDPGSLFPYRKLTEDDYWVDDPESPFYNQFVTFSGREKPWRSAEHLIEETTAYRYVLNICCNPGRIPGKGSAVFLHCSTGGATAGCVSVPEDVMRVLLRKLGQGSRIFIEKKG